MKGYIYYSKLIKHLIIEVAMIQSSRLNGVTYETDELLLNRALELKIIKKAMLDACIAYNVPFTLDSNKKDYHPSIVTFNKYLYLTGLKGDQDLVSSLHDFDRFLLEIKSDYIENWIKRVVEFEYIPNNPNLERAPFYQCG